MKNSFLSKFLEQYEESFAQDVELKLLRGLIGGDSYKLNRVLGRAEIAHPESGIVFSTIDTLDLSEIEIEIQLLKKCLTDLIYLGAVVDSQNKSKA